MKASDTHTISAENVEQRILLLRGEKVLLDFQLAELYQVPTKVLNQAVRRNLERFPDDFMFRLTADEAEQVLRSQIVTSNSENERNSLGRKEILRSQIVTLKQGQHRKYIPHAFTEQGVAMLSSVLRSPRAVQVNITIMRAFVQLRLMLASNAGLSRKLDEMEQRYDEQFRVVFDAIRQLMEAGKEDKPAREMGFHTLREDEDAAPPPVRRRQTKVRY